MNFHLKHDEANVVVPEVPDVPAAPVVPEVPEVVPEPPAINILG
jgi:hypothetical protein